MCEHVCELSGRQEGTAKKHAEGEEADNHVAVTVPGKKKSGD